MTELIFWEGPGWYASQAGHSKGWSRKGVGIEVLTYRFGWNPDRVPTMRGTGYGTPTWVPSRPNPVPGELFVEDK